MMTTQTHKIFALSFLVASCVGAHHPGETPVLRELVIGRHTNVIVHAPAEMMADDIPDVAQSYEAQHVEIDRRRARESVRDLERILREVAGADVTVDSEPASSSRDVETHASALHVWIGSFAEQRSGAVGITAPFGQGFRVRVDEQSVTLYGQRDLSTSYAIYELLDRIGCRWFLPGPLGEVLPAPSTPVTIPIRDERLAPSTTYRAVWFADDAWRRRNREGGLRIEAGHALEAVYLTEQDRIEHPEWTATIHGHPEPKRLHWSNEAVAERLGDRIVEQHTKEGTPTYSISPNDGVEFDDSPGDQALDAADFDPTMGTISITDRFVVLANRIATRVATREPNMLLGFLAYVQFTRPPVREHLHPNLVPQIAPITYSRAHPMNDDRVPGNRELRHVVDAWGKLAHTGTSIYFYGFFLSELVAPNPMLTKWGHDVPYVLAHNAKYWQPETLPNFETSMHAIYMGMRVAFDASKKPEDIYAELDARLYGAAGPAMHAYWQEVDRTWVDVPEYSGGLFGHARRFSEARLNHLRTLLEAAKRAASSPLEKRRVELADDSLTLFEEQMRLRREFIAGQFSELEASGDAYRRHVAALGIKWKDTYAFTWTSYAPDTISANYYDAFVKPVYVAATKIAKTSVVDPTVLRTFRFRVEPAAGEVTETAASFDDSTWKSTDVTTESWSSLGLHDWLGGMCYRTSFRYAAANLPSAKSTFLSLLMVDGSARVFVNGHEATYAPDAGDPKTPVAIGGPLRFDVTKLIRADTDNTIAIVTKRLAINELGLGGLMGPVVLHSH